MTTAKKNSFLGQFHKKLIQFLGIFYKKKKLGSNKLGLVTDPKGHKHHSFLPLTTTYFDSDVGFHENGNFLL